MDHKRYRNFISYLTTSYIIIAVSVPVRCSSLGSVQVAYLSVVLSKSSSGCNFPMAFTKGRLIILAKFYEMKEQDLLWDCTWHGAEEAEPFL